MADEQASAAPVVEDKTVSQHFTSETCMISPSDFQAAAPEAASEATNGHVEDKHAAERK